MKLKKMSPSWGNYLAGLFVGIFCTRGAELLTGKGAVEKDITAATIIYIIALALYATLIAFTHHDTTKINNKEVNLCGVSIDTTKIEDGVRISVSGLENRRAKEAFKVMDALKGFSENVRGKFDED